MLPPDILALNFEIDNALKTESIAVLGLPYTAKNG
jgi:hypothetical protein